MEFTYKGLKAQLEKHMVTDAEVDRQLQRLLEQSPRIVLVNDRPTERGDEVILDYAGFCDGVQFPGGTAENQTLVLGSGMFIPGFEEQLLDKVPGEAVTVKVTFPTEYHAPELAGKEARFECVIHAIRVKAPYELNDTFAQEVGKCDTLEQMREQMRAGMQEYADRRGEMELQEQLLDLAADTLDYTPTAEELEAAVDREIEYLTAQLQQQNLTLDMYCSFMNTSVEDLRKDASNAAARELLRERALDEIIRLEGITAEEQEIEKTLEAVCVQNGVTMEQLQENYTPELAQMVVKSVCTAKAMNLIRDAAQVTEE